jgi:hypothetical protein
VPYDGLYRFLHFWEESVIRELLGKEEEFDG